MNSDDCRGETENAWSDLRRGYGHAAVTFGVLYLIAVAILCWRLGSDPSNPVNWETYTLRGLIDYDHHPSWDVLRLNGGLMTNSGQSAVVVWPGWLGFKLFGATLLGLRLPLALIAALSIPLTWLLGRALHSQFVGVVGALLVATSQAFLIYGRTGTNVGISITPALIGYLILWRCVKPDQGHWWRWVIGLQIALVINSYFYSPIRFLWPIAMVLLATEIAIRRGERKRFLISLGLTAICLPIAVTLLRPGPLETPATAVKDYYYGRGEQVFDIAEFPDGFKAFLRTDSDEERVRLETESSNDLVRRLIRQNTFDLFKLLVDRDTLPPNENFWNPQGRLYPLGLVPFFLLGTVFLLVRFIPDPRARLLLALFWGFSLPLLLTSRVHIGRLVFVVPLLAIICAIPIGSMARWVGREDRLEWRPAVGRWLGLAGGASMIVISAVPGLNYWNEPFPIDRTVLVEQRIDQLIQAEVGDRFVYIFGDLGGYEVEGLRVAHYEIAFRNRVRFLDMTNGEERGSGPITFVYGAILPLPSEPDWIPGYCTNVYLVEPDQLEQFRKATGELTVSECDTPLRVEVLDV